MMSPFSIFSAFLGSVGLSLSKITNIAAAATAPTRTMISICGIGSGQTVLGNEIVRWREEGDKGY